MSVKLTHRAIALKPSRQVVRCLFALAEPQARAFHALRSRPAGSALSAVAVVISNSPKQATRGFRNHRAKALPAQLVPALARRRRQMLASLWALPLSESRRGLRGTEPSGSGVSGVQPSLAFPPSVTPNPSFKRTASPPLNSNVRRQREAL